MKTRNGMLRLSLALVLASSLLSIAHQPVKAYASYYFVTPTGSGVAATCPRTAPCSLRHAIDLAVDGDYIYVAHGIYTGSGGYVINITHSIHLLGSWNGDTGDLWPVRDVYKTPSQLDGQSTRRVIHIQGAISPVIDGFFIRNGNASGTGAECQEAPETTGCGGAIFSYQAAPHITHNRIEDSEALVSNDQTSWGVGGGIYLLNPGNNTLIEDNDIRNNKGVETTTSNHSRGGGVYINEYQGAAGTVTVRRNNFAINHAFIGGGIFVSAPDLQVVIDQNTFSGNTSGGSDGSAIYTAGGYGEVTQNIFMGQHDDASVQSAIVEFSGSGFTFIANRMSTNNTNSGPAVEYYHPLTTPLLLAYNNIIAWSGSPAFRVIVDPGQTGVLYLYHNTLYAGTLAKMIAVKEEKTCSPCQTVGVVNTIIEHYTTAFDNVDSSTNNLIGLDVVFGTADSVYNTIQANPKFVSAAKFDYHLAPDSPAVNSAYCPMLSPCAAVDFENDPRPLWGAYDIGADEFDVKNFLPLLKK